MTKADSTYQNTKVHLPQGGGTLSVDSDGKFSFFGTEVTGQQLYNLLYSPLQNTIIVNTTSVLSVVNLPANNGTIIFSIAVSADDASAWLTSGAKEGQELIMMTRGACSTASVFISMSGVSVIGFISGDVSSISMHCSAASQAFIRLRCLDDDCWSVMELSGQTTVNAST